MYEAVLLSILVATPAAWIVWIIRKRSQRRRCFDTPLPDGWVAILHRNVPIYGSLPEPLRKQLGGHINVFLAEKNFEGCDGLEITDEIRLTIGAQACLLLLNRKTGYYPHLDSILVYPGAYVAKTTERRGYLETTYDDVRGGESWDRGVLVLSWDDVLHGSLDFTDGYNVVLHEFAHQLDEENGTVEGTPALESESRYSSWARVFKKEYKALQRAQKAGEETVIDYYGASHPAEFFAVATEAFFERPKELRLNHPALYEELKGFYHVDPSEWETVPAPDEPA